MKFVSNGITSDVKGKQRLNMNVSKEEEKRNISVNYTGIVKHLREW